MKDLKDFDVRAAWNQLAEPYELARTKPASPDELIEYPQQIDMMGDIRGKTILDIGCGSGAKCVDFIRMGAKSVTGLDVSDSYINAWNDREKPDNLFFLQADFNRLDEVEALREKEYNIITSFMVLGYAYDLSKVYNNISKLLSSDGELIVQLSSPLRWIAMKAAIEDGSIGRLYHDDRVISYESNWNPEVTLVHNAYRFSDLVNAGMESGLALVEAREPDFPEHLREQYPNKALWWDSHGGVILLKYRKLK
jgi:SAM-dependent methyltransferase